jgi:hypothetical protein
MISKEEQVAQIEGHSLRAKFEAGVQSRELTLSLLGFDIQSLDLIGTPEARALCEELVSFRDGLRGASTFYEGGGNV